ncbi:MAG: hypothetical protein ACI8TP_002035, partial [Acidimicrobiales bacterium]
DNPKCGERHTWYVMQVPDEEASSGPRSFGGPAAGTSIVRVLARDEGIPGQRLTRSGSSDRNHVSRREAYNLLVYRD